jgi:hypothetical protein
MSEAIASLSHGAACGLALKKTATHIPKTLPDNIGADYFSPPPTIKYLTTVAISPGGAMIGRIALPDGYPPRRDNPSRTGTATWLVRTTLARSRQASCRLPDIGQ